MKKHNFYVQNTGESPLSHATIVKFVLTVSHIVPVKLI